MKNLLSLIYLLLCSSLFGYANNPDVILQKTSEQLIGLKAVQYDLTRELNYASEDYFYLSEWDCYYDFSLKNKPVGFRYQINDKDSKSIYNGTEQFKLFQGNNTFEIEDKATKRDFEGLSFFYNSIITLKSVLPMLIDDPDAAKSLVEKDIDGRSCYVISINVGKRRIQHLGEGFDNMTTPYNFIYQLTIDRETFLPVEILQSNDLNKDFIKTSFANINVNPLAPAENSWYYSSYAGKFKPVTQKVQPPMLTAGSPSPEWQLKTHTGDEVRSLSDLKGKVVLIEFWIKNCGACISSVPVLNELRNQFEGEDFELLGVNLYDESDAINQFVKRHNVQYPILVGGEQLSEAYGVDGFPAIFILDRSGDIIYAHSGLNKSVLSDISKILKKELK